MNDPAPATRLDMLRFARRVVEQQAVRQLALIDRWIADEERLAESQRRAVERRPPPPEWVVQRGGVHVGSCWAVTKGSWRSVAATREQALDALRNGVPPCEACRPDRELGFLE
ncbi:DUF6233 domain-containing protein [Streptomyces sp. NPDC088794]|uniref:DUF6233 domain-containing protein n=1 Tax=Streptomyces sp. NPDC088794 TaxID=3365902 RepID=UPI0037F3F3D7